MASASSGGGGAGGGPHSSASPSSSAAGAPPSPASLDGGLLLRLLQNPPPPQPRHQTPAAAAAAGPPQQPLFVDPAVAAVGPLFPSASPAGLPHPQHGGGFAWPSPSPSNPQQQQQLRFPDPRFALPLDPYAALGYGGSGAGSRAEKPRSGAPPPGFTTKASSSHPAAASSREASNAFGGMQQRREPNHQHPRSFGRTLEEQRMARPSVAAHEGLVGAAPGVLPTMRITGGRDMGSGMMNREQHHQRQDHFLSRTPPNGNGPGLIGRMPRGEQLMHSTTGGRMNHGEQHMGTVAGGRLPHRGLRQQDHSLAKMPQGEHRWQGHRDEKGHTSLKLPNENMHGMFSTTSEKEQHQVTMPTSGLVNMDVRENRGKKIVTEANGLEDGVVGGVGFKEIVDGEVVVEARKFEVSDKTNEVRSIGQDEEADDGNKDDDGTIEQLMETVVIDDNGETKSAVVQINGSRSKNFRLDFSRGYIVSSQNVRFHRRNRPCRYDIDQFTPGFMSIFESLVPSDEEISKQKQLLTTLSRLINKEWPTSKLYLYGSCANSFGFSNSDIDLCLSIDDKDMSKVDIILKLADILHAGNLQNIQALTHARVPIVKLMDPITGLSCDICVNNLLAVVNTKLLRDYSQIDKRLRQLAFIVKHWAKSRRVNETYRGTLSSYAYVIMCIHFLQSRRILPCLQEMEPTYYVTVDNNICAYFDQVEKLNGFGAQRKDSLSRLLWAFFKYWAYEHNYTRDVISIRTGRIISKHMKDWTRRVGNDRHLICIEDPFETSHDLGRVVDRNTISDLRGEFERAAEILQYDPNPIVTLFEPFVPSPQGLNQAEENFEQQ